jgi:hypothetical protein
MENEAPPADTYEEAPSDEPMEPETQNRAGDLILGLEVGGIFPQLFTSLGTHASVGIEVGYRLPFADRKLELMLASAYSPPGRTFTDGVYEADVTLKELTVSLGARFRFLDVDGPFNVNAAVGPRMYLLESTSNGSANGEPFAEFVEQSTQFGFFVAVGGEYRLGPGALLLDLDIGYASLPHKITGDESTGNLTATLGYRFFLL